MRGIEASGLPHAALLLHCFLLRSIVKVIGFDA
jgi:hypothetical protein